MIDNRCAARKGGRLASLAAMAAVFLALAPAAKAQGLFGFFGGGPDPYDIERRLDASGYTLTGPLMRRGNVYLADVVAGRHDTERLIIDAQTGRIVQRFRTRPRTMDEQANTWWGAPRPPGDVDLPPPRDLFAREEPSSPDQIDKPKAKPHEAKHKTTPASPASAQASEPTPAATPTSAPVAATPPSPTPTTASAPSAASQPAASETTTKSEDPPAAQSSPTPTTAATAPATAVAAKSPEPAEPRKKAVNDLPVTPLD